MVHGVFSFISFPLSKVVMYICMVYFHSFLFPSESWPCQQQWCISLAMSSWRQQCTTVRAHQVTGGNPCCQGLWPEVCHLLLPFSVSDSQRFVIHCHRSLCLTARGLSLTVLCVWQPEVCHSLSLFSLYDSQRFVTHRSLCLTARGLSFTVTVLFVWQPEVCHSLFSVSDSQRFVIHCHCSLCMTARGLSLTVLCVWQPEVCHLLSLFYVSARQRFVIHCCCSLCLTATTLSFFCLTVTARGLSFWYLSNVWQWHWQWQPERFVILLFVWQPEVCHSAVCLLTLTQWQPEVCHCILFVNYLLTKY